MKTSLVALMVLVLLVIAAAVSNSSVAEAGYVWPGPDGVTAADGMSPGEAVLTWSTVEKVAYYRIGWIAGAEYQTRADGGADWQEGFVFTDVANRGQASHSVSGLTPGKEYHFVVASHDGRIPTLPPPQEFVSFRLREDVHPNEYAPPRRPEGDADSKLVAGEGVWPSVDFQNSGACESTVGSDTVTMFGEDMNRYLCQDTQGSIYRVFVPVQYTSPDAIAKGMHRRANDGMQNRGKRVAIYKALILELAIQKALQDRNHEDVYVDSLQTGRDISSNANEVADYVRTGYDLADLGAVAASDLAQHIDHVLHSTTLGTTLWSQSSNWAKVDAAPSPEGDRIVLHGGTLNGNQIVSTNPSLRVTPGQSISGTVDLSVTNHHGGHAIFPVGATTTWGAHQTSYWRLPIRPPAFGTRRQEVSVDLTAPEQPGNYAIIFAAQAETSLGHVMSGTHWPSGGPRWDNGDDVAGWNASQVDFAIANGYVLAPQHGWGQPTARFGAAAVKIVVSGDASPSGTLGRPTGLTAAPGSQAGEVVLRWTPAANATVHWVYVQKADGTDGRYWDAALAGDANTVTITGLQAGETYQFRVRAGQEQATGDPVLSAWNAVDAVAGGASTTAPDLVVRSASVSDSNVEAGDSFTFTANVYNQGDGTASATTLRYYQSTDSNVDVNDTEVSTDGVTSLNPTDRSGKSERLTTPSSEGTYYFGACVDPVQRESNTSNNCSSSVRVTVTAAAQGAPDLVVYSPSVYDKVFDPGERFDMSFWVQNQGEGGSTTNATLKYYRSSDATISPSDTELAIRTGTVGVGPIAASARTLVSIRLNAHTSGVYYYGVCVGNVPSESNTTNNCAAVFKVTLASPDLVVRSASVSDSSVEAGDSFTFTANVYNQGDGTASTTTLRYYRSTDSTVDTNDTEVSTDGVTSLDPAEDDDESERLTTPSSEGTYYFGACVDPVRGESNTHNNCSSSVRVTVTAAGQDAPDLVADPPTFSDDNPEWGTSIRLSARVRNLGDATASTTTLRIYYSIYSDLRFPRDVIDFDVASLRASSARPYTILNQHVPTSVGTFYYYACVDAVSGESDTQNNCSEASVLTTRERSP